MKYTELQQINGSLHNITLKTGTKYTTAAEKIRAFRMMYPDGGIITEVVHFDGETVLIKATITDQDGHTLATGHATETKGSNPVNKTNFVENCETSAVARALGALGLGADKMDKAITAKDCRDLEEELTDNQKAWIYKRFAVGSLGELSPDQYKAIKNTLESRRERQSA